MSDLRSSVRAELPSRIPAVVGALAVLMLACVSCRPPASSSTGDAESSQQQAPVVAQKAGVGVGKSTQAMDRHGKTGDVVAGPAKTLFRTKEKLVFEIQIPQALSLYKAEHGKGPQSHDEFMEKIIRRNSIKLPELPPGRNYQFDVEKQELWVVPDTQ